jgi:hypothetical protein
MQATWAVHASVSSWKLLISRLFTEFVLQFCLCERSTTPTSTAGLSVLKSASRRSDTSG